MKSKLGWALVTKGGAIDLETVRSKKTDVKAAMTIFDEETDTKVKRVRVTVVG